MFTLKDLNLQQRRCLELLKDYDISVLYHLDKVNVVPDARSRITMGSVSHIDESTKDLVRDVHRLGRLGVRLEGSLIGGVAVHQNCESTLVVKVKFKQHLDQLLIELKESVLGKLNEPFSLERDGILRYQGTLCVPNVNG